MTDNMNLVLDSIKNLDGWISNNNCKDYDPFDGLSAHHANILTFDNHYLRIMLQQTVRRFPFNLRPLLGIKKETSSKGMGFCALGYLKLYQATRDQRYLEKMKYCLDWLMKNYTDKYSGYCWGNHFSYESRGGRIGVGVPTIVWTSLIGNVFFDAFEAIGEKAYFDVAKSSCDFIMNDLGAYKDSEHAICFMYTPHNKNEGKAIACVHNANVLGGWLLSRLYEHTKKGEILTLARKSINYTLKYQLPTGGWYYGEAKKFRWEDNFHTGYNLESIHGYMTATGDEVHEDKLVKGFEYYKSTFFEEDGTPRYYNHKTYPIDIQCAAQGIQTLVNLSEYDQSSLELAEKVALWTIGNMQDPKGYFYFRKYPVMTNKTPMFHWGQATMLSALAHLVKKLGEQKAGSFSYEYKQLKGTLL
jgi:polysaccharide biosynthesis protein VpsJ